MRHGIYCWWRNNVWRSKGRRICERREWVDPWVARRLLRNRELLLLQRAATNGDTPRANSMNTLVGGFRAGRSTTRHCMPTVLDPREKWGNETPICKLSCTARAPFRRRGTPNSNLCSSRSHPLAAGASKTSNSTNDAETLPCTQPGNSISSVHSITNRYPYHNQ